MQIFYGTIVTCDWDGSVFKYLVEDKGKIIFVGDRLPEAFRYNPAQCLELGARTLLPAFGDGHIHYSNFSVFNSTFDVRSAASIEAIGPIIASYADRDPKTKVLFGFGHSRHAVAENRLITRSELDQIIKHRPVYLVCYDGHSAVANTKAIGMLPAKVRDKRGFDLDTGQLFNEAFLEATDYISGQLPVTSWASSIVAGMDALAAYGVGLVHTTEGVGHPRDLDVDLVRFLSRGSPLQFRIYFQTMDIDKVLKRKLPRLGGCFECALDGAFGTRDAALLEPYCDDEDNRGLLFYSDARVTDFVKHANRAGLQVQLHCVGDAAVLQAVRAIEAALKDYPRQDHRHTLIHAPLIPDGILEKIAELGIGITVQPGFFHFPLEPPEFLETLLGERINRLWPLKELLAMGINVSGGSNGPVMAPDPVSGLFGACNHPLPGQSVGISDALSMFTFNIAHTSFDENERGSLEVGKAADMVLLNSNPLQMEPGELLKLKVEKLYLAGKEYRGGRSVPWAVVEGLKNWARPV